MVRPVLNRCGVFTVVLTVAVGCGGGGPVPVRGTVKLDGRPLAGVTVQFLAQDRGGRDALGFTDAHGVFRLGTFQPADGAFPGKYKVVVQPPAEADSGAPVATQEEAQQAAGRGRPKRSAVSIPPHYSQPDRTTLAQEVPARGDVVLELQSK